MGYPVGASTEFEQTLLALGQIELRELGWLRPLGELGLSRADQTSRAKCSKQRKRGMALSGSLVVSKSK